MPRAFLKDPFLDMASKVWAMPEEYWIDDSPNSHDIQVLKKEANKGSKIDEINLRQEMIEKWEQKKVKLNVKELPGRTRVPGHFGRELCKPSVIL
jgi:hypothetical protein